MQTKTDEEVGESILFREADSISTDRINHNEGSGMGFVFMLMIWIIFVLPIGISMSADSGSLVPLIIPIFFFGVVLTAGIDIASQDYLVVTRDGILTPNRTYLQYLKKEHNYIAFKDIRSIEMNPSENSYHHLDLVDFMVIEHCPKDLKIIEKTIILPDKNESKEFRVRNIFHPLFKDKRREVWNEENRSKYETLARILYKKSKEFGFVFNGYSYHDGFEIPLFCYLSDQEEKESVWEYVRKCVEKNKAVNLG